MPDLLRYVPPSHGLKGYPDPILEDPSNDAVVARFTFEEDGTKWGLRIERALAFEARVRPWLETLASSGEWPHLEAERFLVEKPAGDSRA